MDWHTIAIALGGAVGLPLIGFIWQSFLKREKTFAWGERAGKFASMFLRQKAGVKIGEGVESRFQTTLQDFCDGFNAGLDSDDAETK